MNEKIAEVPSICFAHVQTGRETNHYISKDNQDCLIVYHKLLEAFRNSEKYASPYLNLVGVFFQDLVRILTGYVLKRNELEGPYAPSKEQVEQTLKGMPYLHFKEVLNGIQVENKVFSPRYFVPTYKHKVFSILSGLKTFNLKSHRKVAFAKPGVKIKRLFFRFANSSFKVCFPSLEKINIPGIEPQLSEIKKAIEEIFIALNLPGNPEDMFKLVERHIRSYCSSTQTNRVDYGLVVAGTLLDVNNRILAAKARSKGVPVISLFHGDWDGVLDEPVFGYGERSYCDLFIGYGESASSAYQNGRYTKTLYESPQHITTDSNVARCVYKGRRVEPLGNIANKRIMYVPTLFRLDNRYGPFRDMPVRLYRNWQEALIREFPGIIFKAHPKGLGLYLPPSGAARMIAQQFHECLDMADVFVFDYMSTAFSIAAATPKLIIYFNIGLRNFSELGLQKTKKRCIWIDVDPAHPKNLRERVESFKDKECVNEFTESFSLRARNDGLSREDILLNTITKVVGN